MSKPKNSVPLALMLSSIILLLVLQFLWLRNSFYKSHEDFRRETNMLFRSTLMTMRDSILERSIEPLPELNLLAKGFPLPGPDSIMIRETMTDTLEGKAGRHERISRVQILVSPRAEDSLGDVIRPLASRFYSSSRGPGNYLLRIGPDSLKIDSIHYHFQSALARAGIDLPFRVIQMKRGEKSVARNGFLLSDQVRINSGNHYVVSFSGVNGLLIKDIIPQILFSVFLTLLTTGSFVMMYRSVLTQQRMAELKNDFISNVTHELKTPITTVKVALEALQDFRGLNNPILTREYLDIAQNELNRLSMLTDKVLRTAIFEEQGVNFQKESVDLEKLAEQVIASMKVVFDKAEAHVTISKEGSDFIVSGSTDHLTNVFYNLLDNALKYSATPAEIEVAIKGEPAEIIVSVSDQGQGIPSEYHARIFEKFFRVPTGDVHNVKGYGLGLSYVASVVRSHRGAMHVESETGKGSRFIIKLPRA